MLISSLSAFFLQGAGKWLLLVVAFLAWTAYQRHDAALTARAECREDQLQAQLDAERDLSERLRRLAAEEQEAANRAEDEMRRLEGERDAVLEQLAEDGGDCSIPPGVVERLRRIR